MTDRYWQHPYFVPGALAGVSLLLHLYVNAFAGYGFFRDELYYIVSTRHLAAGYVDHPPLSIWVLAVVRLIFGDSLFAVRLLPALLSAASTFLTGLMVIELGGNRYAQLIACSAFIVSPVFLAMHTFYSMNAIDILLWSLSMLLFLRIVRATSMGPDDATHLRLWVLLGLGLGLGLLNKVGVLWLGFGIGVALLATPLRRYLRTPGPWLAAIIALVLFLPYVIWNAQNDWAHLEFIRNASGGKYAGLSAIDFIIGQFMINNPVSAPLWVAGLLFFLVNPMKVWRAPGFMFLGAFLVLVLNGTSKPEYLSPAFPLLFAAGGVRFQMIVSGPGRILTQRIYPGFVGLSILLAPISLPILPVETYISYAAILGISPSTAEAKELADLPQFYADMFGWRELTDHVSDVHETLSDSEKVSCTIFAQNYGEASAVTFFGRDLGLPPAIAGHNSYFLWGPGKDHPLVVIVIGGREEDLHGVFEEVELGTTHHADYAMPYENEIPIFVCRGLKVRLSEIWPRIKNYS